MSVRLKVKEFVFQKKFNGGNKSAVYEKLIKMNRGDPGSMVTAYCKTGVMITAWRDRKVLVVASNHDLKKDAWIKMKFPDGKGRPPTEKYVFANESVETYRNSFHSVDDCNKLRGGNTCNLDYKTRRKKQRLILAELEIYGFTNPYISWFNIQCSAEGKQLNTRYYTQLECRRTLVSEWSNQRMQTMQENPQLGSGITLKDLVGDVGMAGEHVKACVQPKGKRKNCSYPKCRNHTPDFCMQCSKHRSSYVFLCGKHWGPVHNEQAKNRPIDLEMQVGGPSLEVLQNRAAEFETRKIVQPDFNLEEFNTQIIILPK